MKTIFLFFQNFNPYKGEYAKPYDSTQGMSPQLQMFLFVLVLAFGMYTVFKVRKLIEEDRNKIK